MAGRLAVDSAGRQVEVPDRIERVIAAGPPASVLMTILAPEKLIGWNRRPPPQELPYLPAVVRNCRKSAASPDAATPPTSKS
jgi:iron complex transport system substrate-binding protein